MKKEKKSLGIDIGSSSIKLAFCSENTLLWSDFLPHNGDVPATLSALIRKHHISEDIPVVVTGGEGRKRLKVKNVVLPLATEAVIARYSKEVSFKGVASLGGEGFFVYRTGEDGTICETITGDKCASGTGEFFKQQLLRMNMTLEEADRVNPEGKVHSLASRCSVFMKSDCTHKLNKKEATPAEIVLSLSHIMAQKVCEFLKRARITEGDVLLIGGVSRNPFVRRFLAELSPAVHFLYLPESPCLEAYGAALLAQKEGTPLPATEELFIPQDTSRTLNPPLKEAERFVRFMGGRRGNIKEGGEYILGIDGGSTTTKIVLVDPDTKEIVFSHYGRTHGDPIQALKRCLQKLQEFLSEMFPGCREKRAKEVIRIFLASTTGSSREILGVFMETTGVYNEILAHTVGVGSFDRKIDTIFEIGGQDAKYVYLNNGVPVDYAMNEACSAGTGSFIEESCSGDLHIHDVEAISPCAIDAENPLQFGEHCSAFINTDIRTAIQEGATQNDIVGGIVQSIVRNYLNRVVGSRNIGKKIVLQGGVAKNRAIAFAFASELKKEVIVPPDPELMGAYGTALLARQRWIEGELSATSYSLENLLERSITYGKEFSCPSCDNKCPIKTIHVEKHRSFFGGRCDKFTNMRKKKKIDMDKMEDLIAYRHSLIFEKYAPDASSFVPRFPKGEQRKEGKKVIQVAIPKVFGMYDYYPLYSHFFHHLGVKTILVDTISEEGIEKIESSFCFPVEIAHGITHSLFSTDADYYFLPQVKFAPSLEKEMHATICPYVQGLPYYSRSTFSIGDSQILSPVIDFRKGYAEGGEAFVQLAETLGFEAEDGKKAFQEGIKQLIACRKEQTEKGKQVIQEARQRKETVILLLGRSYNAFSDDANMGIPRKFLSRGYRVLPNTFMPLGHEQKVSDNMYWYWGQVNLKSAVIAKEEADIFPCYITNFSCGPDSFILHEFRSIMGAKPFLVLETDSHTADAGIDTRIEAFLDIIEGYKRSKAVLSETKPKQEITLHLEGSSSFLIDHETGEKVSLQDRRVRLYISALGKMATTSLVEAIGARGINTVALPDPTKRSLQRAKDVASGKECLPTLHVLGGALEQFDINPPEPELYHLVLVPSTNGPCRTGQYANFYEQVFKERGWRNVLPLPLTSENNYTEFGRSFPRIAWWSFVATDMLKDIEELLLLCAKDKKQAKEVFQEEWEKLVPLFRGSPRLLLKGIERLALSLRKVPLIRDPQKIPQVLIVGEVYVRREEYSHQELCHLLRKEGIFGKLSGLTEWLHYSAYLQRRNIGKQLREIPVWRRFASPLFKEFLLLNAEECYKKWAERKVYKALSRSGLLRWNPLSMEVMMQEVSRYTDEAFETEATVSIMAATTAKHEGYHGVVVIAPFACMIGRLVQSVLTPHLRRDAMPMVTVETEGNEYSPSLLNQLEMFMVNVRRRRSPSSSPVHSL